jgi:hypothetical protein
MQAWMANRRAPPALPAGETMVRVGEEARRRLS